MQAARGMSGRQLAAAALLGSALVICLLSPSYRDRASPPVEVFRARDPTELETLVNVLREATYEELARARSVSLPPDAADRPAVPGPRRCYGVDCYVVEVALGSTADGQPVVRIVFLGLPASGLTGDTWTPPPSAKGPHAAFMLDVRSGTIVRIDGRQVRQKSPTQFRAVVRRPTAWWWPWREVQYSAACEIVTHAAHGGLNAHYESATWQCQLPQSVPLPEAVELQARTQGGAWRPLTAAPFSVSPGGSGGIMAAARRPPTRPGDSRVSACIAGVDYWNPHPRELTQYYQLLGLQHVYFGLPAFPGDAWGEHFLHQLLDFREEGFASVVVSAYTECMVLDIGEERLYHSPGRAAGEGPRECFRYRPAGHGSPFSNACLLHARRHGDAWTIVGDYDDVIVPTPPPAVHEMRIDSLIRYVARQHEFQDPEKELCALNMRLWDMWGPGHGRHGVGPTLGDRWPYARDAMSTRAGGQAAATYGKSIHNAQRVLRVGLHMPAHCEGADEAQLEMQPWDAEDAKEWKQARGADSPPVLVARTSLEHIGSMHFINIFSDRGYANEIARALKSPPPHQAQGAYSTRWLWRVRAALETRQQKSGIEPWPAEAVRREAERRRQSR
eukprot:TRINITY_DN4892_c1_g1_i1.p1 TRINITY_DN4892_c1_g1~~TRINITY_DN4892_c1_g1_i1.p1  ORF type:complete len:637 (+),score=153.53 TRINITY_DN4892_c1_g1_i1:65-1912(+)